jgi:hypothetical protein
MHLRTIFQNTRPKFVSPGSHTECGTQKSSNFHFSATENERQKILLSTGYGLHGDALVPPAAITIGKRVSLKQFAVPGLDCCGQISEVA